MKKQLTLIVLILSAVLLVGCASAIAPNTTDSVKTSKLAVNLVNFINETTENTHETNVLKGYEKANIVVSLGDGIAQYYLSEGGYGSMAELANSVTGKTLVDTMIARQNAVFQAMDNLAIDYEVSYTYTTMLNGFAIKTYYSNIEKIQSIPEVEGAYLAQEWTRPTAVAQVDKLFAKTGLFENETGYNGEGMSIAILDSAFEIDHEAFSNMPEKVSLTKEDVTDILGSKYYHNAKVPYAYDYADNDLWVIPDERDMDANHGTHVAGIAVGDSATITSAASKAQLVAMKVFADYATTCSFDTILAALNDALLLGVDAVNLSLGSAGGFVYQRNTTSIAASLDACFDLFNRCGIILCVASGNDNLSSYKLNDEGTGYICTSLTSNPDNGIVGMPASFRAALSVGSVENSENLVVTVDDKQVTIYNSVDANSLPNDFFSFMNGSKGEFEFAVISGKGVAGDYDGIDVENKIVLVERGDLSFTEKATVAAEHGAIAIIVFNNESDAFTAQLTQSTIPVATITMSDAAVFMNATEKVIVCDRSLTSYTVSMYSSSGALEDLSLGVDILGIGGNVYSAQDFANAWNYSSYYTNSGTSMATPNVASAILTVKQYVKERFYDKTNYEILSITQSLIMSTAKIVLDENGVTVSPRTQGAGLANLTAAVNANAYLSVLGSDRAKLNLGSDVAKDGVYTLSFNLNNIGNEALSYDVSTIVLTERAENGYMTDSDIELGHAIKVSAVNAEVEGNIVTVKAGQTASIKVVVTIDESAKTYMDENYENGIYVEGYAVLESLSNDVSLSIPFIAFYGDWYQAPIFEPTDFDSSKPVQNMTNKIEAGRGNTPGVSYTFANENYATLAYDDGILYVHFSLLRNCSTFNFRIYDKDTGDVLLSDGTVNYSKSYTYYGQQYSYGYIRLALGVSEIDTWLHNDSAVFEISATFNDSEKVEVINLPFKFDFEKPQVGEVTKVEDDGKTYLDISLYDNTAPWLLIGFSMDENQQRTFINNAANMEILVDMEIINGEYRDGIFNTFRLDITDDLEHITANGNALYLTIYDWAWNVLNVKIELDSNVEENEGETENIFTKVDSETGAYTEVFTYNSNAGISSEDVYVTDDSSDFVIINGELTAYNGAGGDVVVPDEVVSIRNNVFYNKHNITSVTLPEGLKSLGNNNFRQMKALTKIVLPSTLETIGTYTFTSLQALEEFNLQDTKIKKYNNCFNGIGAPAEIIIPDVGEDITIENSFMYVMNNTTITIKASISLLKNSLYILENTTTLNFENTVKAIDAPNGSSVRGCHKLETINFYKDVEVMGYQERTDFSFQSFGFGILDALKEVNFYGNVGSINGTIFNGCTALEKVSFGGSVEYIGPGVFQGSNIQSYTLMEGNTQLVIDSATNAMYNADKTKMFLTPAWDYEGEFIVPETVELCVGQFCAPAYKCTGENLRYGFNANGSHYLSTFFTVAEAKEYKTNTTSIVLPENAKEIPETCFYGLMGLKKISSVENIEKIGTGAFSYSGIEELEFSDNLKEAMITPFVGMPNLRKLVLSDNLYVFRPYQFMLNCTALEEFRIPSAIEIANATNMLEGATSLKKVSYYGSSKTIPNYMFTYCSSLETVEGFESVKTVNSYAFAFTGLKEITLPNVTYINTGAFGGCTSLERYTFSEDITGMNTNAFADAQGLKEIYIGAKLKINFSSVFTNLVSLETITVADGNANYASVNGALYNSAMTSIIKYPTLNPNVEYEIPETVTEIDNQVFLGVKNLETIIMNGVRVVGDYAFSESGIKEVIASNLVQVGVEAFAYTGLESIDLSNVYYIDTRAFAGTQLKEVTLDALSIYGSFIFEGIETLEKVTIGNTDYFPFQASFWNCPNIKEIVVLDSATNFVMENNTLMNAAKTQIFKYLGNEETIVIPEGIVKINAQAYINNASIKEVILPTTLKLVGAGAFYGCNNLESVTFLSEKAPLLEATYTTEYSLINCNFIDYVENIGENRITAYVPEINDSYNTYVMNLFFDLKVKD